ncbi:hypothetical protein [Erwinia persicina]|uniref:hypothetical protein n=1 Tax=Erwinia persicina TaxID=55211 RepID=UPI0013C31669|nr:hypothetical protein [Erwinia persicina]
MKKWLSRQSNLFNKDKKLRYYSNLNWFVHKKNIIAIFNGVVKDAQRFGINLYCDDYVCNKIPGVKYSTYDGVSLSFDMQLTGNHITYKSPNVLHNDVKKQTGANLHVTYNKTGMLLVFIFPSTSTESVADYKGINIYSTYNPGVVTDELVRKWIKKLFLYDRSTGRLHTITKFERLKYYLLLIQSYLLSYRFEEERFKKLTGVYIPILGVFFGALACCLVTYQIYNTP